MADKDKLRFLTGQEANLKNKALTRGQVYFAINSDTDSGKIYFDAPIDENTTKRILMSSDHAKTADKATSADRAIADSNGRKFTETYVSEIKLDNAGTTILYKYPDITTWKELKPKFLPLTGGTITGELYADSITAGDLLVNGSARFVNTILGNIETANQWKTARGFQIADSDAAHTSVTVNVNGSSNVVLKLPSTIKATLEGNASSANKVNHKYTLTLGTTKQTAFDGSADVAITITPKSIGALASNANAVSASKWSTARTFYIADAGAAHTGTGVSVDGTKDVTLQLPSVIKGNLEGNADTSTTAKNADKLDGYHRAGLYSSPGEWITANGYTQTIIVNGDADTYYPVVISTATEKSALNYISVWKNLNTKTATYPGNHSNGTSSMWLVYEGRNWYWDGNGGYLKCWYYSMPYATLCAKAEQANDGVGALVVYLRGGETEYKISTTYSSTVTVYYETTNLGSTTHPVNVTPTTTIGNMGIISSTYLGYGNVPTADTWKTARNFAVADNGAAHTGPTVIVNGSSNVTLQLPATIKASITGHASEDLPLAGGVMTGNISYKGSKATSSMIRFLNNTTDTSGNGISIGGGGVTVIGAGESSQNLTPAANEEALYLTSDGSIKFYTYCDTIGNKRGVILDTSRNFYPDVNNSGSIGTSSNKWASMYATTFYGALSGTASNATSDIRGNAIIDTYLTNVYAKSDDSSYLYKQVGPSSERSAELIGRYTPLDSDGLINMKYIPAAALERVVVVANQAAQYALTTANVQLGDVVKRNDTGQLYFVVDTNNLDNAGGYLQFTAGTATNVNWSGILNRPNVVGRATGNAIVPNTANTEFTVYQVNGNGTSTSYVIKPNFLPKTGGTITGELSVEGETTLANLIVNGDASFVNTIQGSISGNAGTATKWATAKAFYIADADAKHTSSPQVNIDGSQSSYTLKLPSTIKATLEGNADTATKLTNLTEADKASSTNTWRRVWFSYDDNVNGRPAYSDTFAYQSSTGTVKATKFQGALAGNADSASKWKTARSFITNLGSESAASVDGSTGPYNLGVTGTLPVSHGGTGNTAFTANRIIYSESATKLSSSSHYMSNSQVSINSSSAPTSGVTLNINGATTTSNYIKIDGSYGTTATTNYISLGQGYGIGSGKNGLKVVVCDQNNAQTGLGQDLYGSQWELSLATTANGNYGRIAFGYNTASAWSTYTEMGHFSASDKSLTVIGNIIAPNFKGLADKATGDGSGHNIEETYVKHRANGYDYNDLASYYVGSATPTYYRITFPDTSSTWAMIHLEISIRQTYSNGTSGKILIYGQWSSSSDWNQLYATTIGHLTSSIQVFASDKKYIYIKGGTAWGGITVDKMLVGDNMTSYDIHALSITKVDTLPDTYQTATNYYGLHTGNYASFLDKRYVQTDTANMKITWSGSIATTSYLLAFENDTSGTSIRAISPSNITAGKANADGSGNNIEDTYLKRSGGTMTGTINSQIVQPKTNNTYTLGSSSNRWSTLYSINIDNTGSWIWYGNQNFILKATANNQEWSFDQCADSTSYTGTYSQFWSSKNSVSIIRFYTDDNQVLIPSTGFMGIGGAGDASYKLKVTGNTYLTGTLYVGGGSTFNNNLTVNSGGKVKIQNTTDSSNSQDSNASLAIQGGVSVAKQLSAKTVRIDGSSSDTIGSTTQGCTVHFNKTNNCIEFVFD